MKSIETNLLIEMLAAGSKEIADNFEYINNLNVFPVPDGDTGTNMKITTISAIENLRNQSNNNLSIFAMGKIYCKQLLMNARGNSGVIFSQIIRGFFIPIKEDHNAIDVPLLIECFKGAKERAYKAVVNPVEGTILTIIREIAEQIESFENSDIETTFKNALDIGLTALKKTPEILPSLKEAKVVDSGGYGLCKFIEGMYLYLINFATNAIDANALVAIQGEINKSEKEALEITFSSKNTFIQSQNRYTINEEGFGYCCEFVIQKNFITHERQPKKSDFNLKKFEKEILLTGDSLVVVEDNEIVKVHVHSVYPSLVFEVGQKYGEFLKIKVDNMTLQYLENHPEISTEELFFKFNLSDEIKLVVTCPSKKMSEYLKNEFQIENVINTEETGNPSTNEIMNQITNSKSRNVIVLTDDSNILLSANQAADFVKERINVNVIPSKNIVDVICACLVFDANKLVNENVKAMKKAIKKLDCGCIGSSIKTSQFNGVFVEKGDYIGICDKKIVLAEKRREAAIIELLKRLCVRKNAKIVYIVYGQDVKMREINNIEKVVNETYGLKCKFIDGGQKIYSYFVGVFRN